MHDFYLIIIIYDKIDDDFGTSNYFRLIFVKWFSYFI